MRLYGTRIMARGLLDLSPKRSFSPLFSHTGFHQAYSPTFKLQSKVAESSFLSCSPPSYLLSLPRASVQMKSPHPCLGMTEGNPTTRKHHLEHRAMVPSLSHPMVKVRILSMKLSSGKRTKSAENALKRGFKPKEIGLRMAPLLESPLHLV